MKIKISLKSITFNEFEFSISLFLLFLHKIIYNYKNKAYNKY